MKRAIAWSISTTVRNPERLRGFLRVLQQLENKSWDIDNQKLFQILLIQQRLYGYGSPQFYKGLTDDQVALINNLTTNISLREAQRIFDAKDFEDPAMRGRQSINPLKKFGMAFVQGGKVIISETGKLLLQEDIDFEEVFFKSFLKWQLPNPTIRNNKGTNTYDIKPFVATLHLIDRVNKKQEKQGHNAKGISKKEFSLFVPTLLNYRNIDEHAEKIIQLRKAMLGRTKGEQKDIMARYEWNYVKDFLSTDKDIEIEKMISNLNDYGDNIIRYFRLTRYFCIRGNGFYIDLEPRRMIEIELLLNTDDGRSIPFDSEEVYLNYLGDASQPQLPWETREVYLQIIDKLISEIKAYKYEYVEQKVRDYHRMKDAQLQNYIKELREYRRDLEDRKVTEKFEHIEYIKECIGDVRNIFNSGNPPLSLEKVSTLSLKALNDAVTIKPNYPVGDDGEPTFTAPANVPDIECFYKSFNAICEVTMLTRRDQWFQEGQPVMRHLRDFEDKHPDKHCYCLFIAPKIHRDTINTFWFAIKYEFEGSKQKIVPLSISNFVMVLEALVEMKERKKFLRHDQLSGLYDEILQASTTCDNAAQWLKEIPDIISTWQRSIIAD